MTSLPEFHTKTRAQYSTVATVYDRHRTGTCRYRALDCSLRSDPCLACLQYSTALCRYEYCTVASWLAAACSCLALHHGVPSLRPAGLRPSRVLPMPRPRQSRPADPLQRCRQHHHRTRLLRFGERISSSRSCLRLSFFNFFSI